MLSVDEVHEMLNDLADEIPQEFYKDLNGGISLILDEKYSPAAKNNDLYILGQYHRGGAMGRYITIYYGSLMRAYGNLPREAFKKKLRHVLRHEFRHHVESLAGNFDLEMEDAAYISGYLEKYQDETDEK